MNIVVLKAASRTTSLTKCSDCCLIVNVQFIFLKGIVNLLLYWCCAMLLPGSEQIYRGQNKCTGVRTNCTGVRTNSTRVRTNCTGVSTTGTGSEQILPGSEQLYRGQNKLCRGQNKRYRGQNKLRRGQNKLCRGQNKRYVSLTRVEIQYSSV